MSYEGTEEEQDLESVEEKKRLTDMLPPITPGPMSVLAFQVLGIGAPKNPVNNLMIQKVCWLLSPMSVLALLGVGVSKTCQMSKFTTAKVIVHMYLIFTPSPSSVLSTLTGRGASSNKLFTLSPTSALSDLTGSGAPQRILHLLPMHNSAMPVCWLLRSM